MKKFNININYSCISICDSNCKFEYVVTKRTAKSIWINENRFKIYLDSEGHEMVYPEGKYSMQPILRA